MQSKYGYDTITVSWGTSATTASSLISDRGRLIGIKVTGIVWPIAGAVASGCSSVIAKIYDGDISDSTYIAGAPQCLLTTATVNSGGKDGINGTASTQASAGFWAEGNSGVMLQKGYSVMLSSCDYFTNSRIVTGAGTSPVYFPKATVVLYIEY